jgi:aryl sulfotransferase
MLSPWPEFRLAPKEAAFADAGAQTHRRFIKTHSPFNCLPYNPDIKYLFIGRDARDVVWSMFNHHEIMNPEAFDIFNNVPGRVGTPWSHPIRDVREFYLEFLELGYMPGHTPDTNFWACIKSWWDVRNLPNVMLVHYNSLKQDFVGEAKKIADFLEIEVEESLWPQIEKHCSIDYMREQSGKFEDLHIIFNGGGKSFINKGTNGRWKEVLSKDEIARCDDIAVAEMGADCAHWLKTGEITG